MRRTNILLGAFLTLALTTPGQWAHAQKCTKEAKAQAKERFDRGEAFKTLDKYAEAAREYQAAFDICPRPFLLFNAGQMLWLGGKKVEALALYERYLELDPKGRAAPVAREQFFAAAEDLREYDKLAQALGVYERYLELAPNGENAKVARLRVDELRAQLTEHQKELEAQRAAEAKRQAEEAEARRRAEEQRKAEEAARARERANAIDWKPLAVAGTGAAIVLLGGVLHGLAISEGNAYDELFVEICPNGCYTEEHPPELSDKLDSANAKQTLAITSYVVGGAALTAGVAWYLVQRKNKSMERERADPTMAFIPIAGPDVIGGSWHIRF